MRNLIGEPELTEDQLEVLKFLSLDDRSPVEHIAKGVSESVQRTKHFLDGLRQHQLIDNPLSFGGPVNFYLTKASRKYLFDNGLLD